MSQKEVNTEYKFDVTIFKERFYELRKNLNFSQAEFAAFLEIPTGSVGGYENGDKTPNSATLYKIAKKCNISTDYLLGIAEVQNTNKELQDVYNYIGLDEKVIKRLHEIKLAISEETTDDVFAESLQARNESLKNRIDFYNFFLLNDEFLNVVEFAASYKKTISIIHSFLLSASCNLDIKQTSDFLEEHSDTLYRKTQTSRLYFFEAVESFKKGLEKYTEKEIAFRKNLDSELLKHWRAEENNISIVEAAEIIAKELKEGE